MVLASPQMARVHAADAANQNPGLLNTEVAAANMTTGQAAAKHEVLYANVWAEDKGGDSCHQMRIEGARPEIVRATRVPLLLGLAPEDVQSVVFSVLPRVGMGIGTMRLVRNG